MPKAHPHPATEVAEEEGAGMVRQLFGSSIEFLAAAHMLTRDLCINDHALVPRERWNKCRILLVSMQSNGEGNGMLCRAAGHGLARVSHIMQAVLVQPGSDLDRYAIQVCMLSVLFSASDRSACLAL